MAKRMAGHGGRVKHVPQRTCIACRETRDKRNLVRLVRVLDGTVEVDTTGRQAGRGAYLCKSATCWDIGMKRGRLGHVLRVAVTGSDRERLMRAGEEVFGGVKLW